MPMDFINTGVFFPDEVKAMCAELDAGTAPDETAAERSDRATAIIARHRNRKTVQEPPRH